MIRNLPPEIAEEFTPFETIAPNDERYTAYPMFIGYDDDELKGSDIWFAVHVANDGSRWRVGRYSPSRQNCAVDGTYPVIYCRLTK